jgi:tRNA threonylcarbamoyladenosine biosynthesis protein TsaE
MNHIEIVSHSPEQTQQVGERLGEIAWPGEVILLSGNLGAGKTCLTQGIARGLGITEYAASPSFILVREMYGRLPLYHIDFYRLDHLEEIADLGLDEYFYGKGVCVVEWSDKGMALLPPEHLLVEIAYLGDTGRSLTFKPAGERYRHMVAGLADLSRQLKGVS